MNNPFNSRSALVTPEGTVSIYRLDALSKDGLVDLDRLPFSIRVLLENVLRHCGNGVVSEDHVRAVAGWAPEPDRSLEVPFMPGRVVLQDFTGVPAVVDLAAMRDAIVELGGDPDRINPLVQTDLVIDHSVQVDFFGSPAAFKLNVEREMERNGERYQLLRWAQQAFRNFRVVPPGTGIVHQVNLEYLASVVRLVEQNGAPVAFPDTLVGTDSHTTMINGLGVVGWGVGGIEAEAVMLGQPYFMQLPGVVGMKLTGRLPEGATATDLVLVVTQMLRRFGVVGRFVEYFGPGLATLGLADRATIANMSPEYGATIGFFPVDQETLVYLERTGRPKELIERVERYCKEQALFHTETAPDPEYTAVLELDLGTVVPSVAGPRRPQDRVPLAEVKQSFHQVLPNLIPSGAKRALAKRDEPHREGEGGQSPATAADIEHEGSRFHLRDGSVVIAAITSCTNTSNPSVMIGAGLVARNAVAKGLQRKPWVKTSMAPGSKVVTDYLKASGLLDHLETLGFHVVGYGCTTCIGNSGPLAEPIAQAISEHELVCAAVLSGNRNFEARIHPLVRATYLGSPMLVVAYAIAGRIDIDLTTEPLGEGEDGKPVYLGGIWPSPDEIKRAVTQALRPEMFEQEYAAVFEGDDRWKALPVPEAAGGRFAWDAESTYIANPPFFAGMAMEPPAVGNVAGGQVLVWLGDSVTTDHISPAGAIPKDSPAGRWLMEHGVKPVDFNTFGSRRGNHDIMMRGTFGNIRIRNKLVEGREGNWTEHLPSGEVTSVYEAAARYLDEGAPLLVLGGKEYGSGSSRDWAAKGTSLLGVRAVLAESYERIHRSNLIGMGVLPLQFQQGESAASHELTGREEYDIAGIGATEVRPGGTARVTATRPGGSTVEFDALIRLDTAVEVEYYRHGGILPYVLRQLARE
ncbi:MAG: aconitate hydratase AcnA [Gemmatimonadales bacterium]|nr:aconitate hydratase AcnA [Gemmatimonadales bacterium]NIN13370.1 aconitate hydratase AcnA [Gemmatimonadales bacterium]NIN51373.1 aconitate hydratase AcnA [Gemmatimonadales bacterium]NIP08837.1 aconitate hydratase AcnA [Gemmatimonadales bacterium]NIQ99831.1 aconitate hydratase AcnA [Gemmatimonadales bacterium]